MILHFSQTVHDIRTPLTAMMASNDFLLHKHRSNIRSVEVLEIQKSSGLYLQNLIEDVLDFSRI
jgi:signal transduction histidine kinase